jgi:hypothetical protein
MSALQLPQVVYVDDPRMFGLLGQMFPGAQLVQDAFHLLDRFSRTIPATNTLKSKHTPIADSHACFKLSGSLIVCPVPCACASSTTLNLRRNSDAGF